MIIRKNRLYFIDKEEISGFYHIWRTDNLLGDIIVGGADNRADAIRLYNKFTKERRESKKKSDALYKRKLAEERKREAKIGMY